MATSTQGHDEGTQRRAAAGRRPRSGTGRPARSAGRRANPSSISARRMPLTAWKAKATNTRYSPTLNSGPVTESIARSQRLRRERPRRGHDDVQQEVGEQAEPGEAVQRVEVALDAPPAAAEPAPDAQSVRTCRGFDHVRSCLPRPLVLSLDRFPRVDGDRLVVEARRAVGLSPRQGVLEPLLVVAGGEVAPGVGAARLLAGRARPSPSPRRGRAGSRARGRGRGWSCRPCPCRRPGRAASARAARGSSPAPWPASRRCGRRRRWSSIMVRSSRRSS